MAFTRGTHAQTHWPRQRGKPVKVDGVLFTNELRLLAQAALTGAGIAMVPAFLVQPLIDTGKLVVVHCERAIEKRAAKPARRGL